VYFSEQEYERRWSATLREMDRLGYEAAVVWNRSGGTHDTSGDVFWLTNFYAAASGAEPDSSMGTARPWCAVILRPGREPLLHTSTPGRPNELAVNDHRWHRDLAEGVAEAIKSEEIKGEVALCNTSYLPLKYADWVAELLPEVNFVPADDLVREARRIKSPPELDCYREGGRRVSKALALMFERLIGGATEAEAAAAAAEALMREGGNFHMIPVTHGPYIEEWCTDPLNGYATIKPSVGDLVRAWIYGPIWQGYWMDPGRTAVVGGTPSDDQRELIESAASIVDACIDAIQPGVRALEIAELGDRLRKEAGGGDDMASEMWPFFGHGLGVSWEDPLLALDNLNGGELLEEGMVLGIEAFLSREGVGAAGFEQNVIVGARGAEVLIEVPMLLH
jgi:Xaa-Pro dipeptidase